MKSLLLPSLLLMVAVIAIPACGGGGGGSSPATPPPPPPPPAFTVSTRVPANGAMNVSRTQVVYVKFNHQANATTITNTTFFLNDGVSNVVGTINYDPCDFLAWFVPTAPLATSTTYTMNLTAGIQDTIAVSLTPTTFSFTTSATGDVTPPTFAGLVSAVATVGTTNSIDLAWAAGDGGDLTLVYQVFRSTMSNCYDWSTPLFTTAAGSTGATVSGHSPNTTYFYVVRARDTAGNVDQNEIEVSGRTRVSFLTNVYNGIMTSNCRSCHTGGGEGATQVPTMSYSTATTTYNTWVNVAPTCISAVPPFRVSPSSAANSFVIDKISNAVPSCGVRMPKDDPPLSAAQIQTVTDWVNQGADNN